MSDRALFVVAPCLSIVVLVVAALVRARHDGPVNVLPSSAAPDPGSASHPLPLIGFLGVLMGHLVMVAWPNELLRWNRDLPRLVTFELALFAFGIAALAGTGVAVWRRVLRRTDNGAGLVDAAFMGVLLLTLISGLGIAVVYRWAAVWSAVTVTRYARSLLSFQPNLESLEAMPYLVKLHIFSSFIVVALMAFTRPIDVWLHAMVRAARVVIGPFVSAADRQWRLLRTCALRNGRHLMWPEEDD